MPIQILMPALSPTMKEGNLVKWLKAEGDKVKAGQVLAEIETDKATMEVEAVDEGILGRIVVPAGTEGVQVNQLIALILEEGEDASALDSVKVISPAPQAAPAEVPASAPTMQAAIPAPTIAAGGRVAASPLAKRLAVEKSIDIRSV